VTSEEMLGQVVDWGHDGAHDGPKGDTLWIFRSLYSLGGLKPCGNSCWTTTSESDNLLTRLVIFHSIASV
jgi:hypothetical protein